MTTIEIILLGIIGGISPGPITAMIFGETLKYGWKQGIKIPFALVVSNVFFSTLTLTLLYLGSNIDMLLIVLKYVGALVLIFFGIQEFRSGGKLDMQTTAKPFRKALAIEIFNPHPYIIWFTVLASSIMLNFQEHGFPIIIINTATFIISIVLTKITIVFIVHFFSRFLNKKNLSIVSKVTGLILIIFALNIIF